MSLKVRGKAREFLKFYGLDHQGIDMEAAIQDFLEEMARGLSGKGQSSLPMLPTFLEIGPQVPLNQRVIVLDAGGSNLRVASVFFNSQTEPVIENFRKHRMPGLDAELGREEFYAALADSLSEVINSSDRIGFCFSYAVEMAPNKDGKALFLGKEVKAKSVEGSWVGAGLNQALQAKGGEGKRVVLLNDAVASLLAGVAAAGAQVYESYLGFILGTGTNIAYLEQNQRIAKLTGLDPEKDQIINVESGSYSNIPQGQLDREFDSSTAEPGKCFLEKMVSGRYLGGLCDTVIKRAAADGLFSRVAAQQLEKLITPLCTVDLDQFLRLPHHSASVLANALRLGIDEDRTLTFYLVDEILERAAKLGAISVAAAILKSGKGQDPNRPVCLTVEGTTFYQLKSYQTKFETYLRQFLVEQKGIHFQLVTVNNATLIGTAVAALTN